MAEAMFERPSFWKVPREFRARSHSPNPYSNNVSTGNYQSSLEHKDFLSENYYYDKMAQKSQGVRVVSPQQQRVTSPCRLHNDHFNQVTPLSSASDAGVRPGDVVLAINNKSIAGEPLDRATGLIANDKSNNISLTLGRPSGHYRSVSPMGMASASYSPVSYSLPTTSTSVSPMMKPLPRSPNTLRRYDPASIQDQERQVYDEEKYTEQLAIKTTPYRSQAVVSPKPKTKHDHVIGSYLKMQHYPDAPVHGSPVPDSYLPAQLISNQSKFANAVKQAAPTAEELGFKLTYNSPIGLYSQENAINTLKQTNPMTVKQPVSSVTYDPMKSSSNSMYSAAGSGNIPKPVKLVPDDTLVDGADFARNLANSPTYRLVQELEGPGRHHDAVVDRVYTPIPVYEERQFGETERHSPAQSASFKSLMNSLIAHPSV